MLKKLIVTGLMLVVLGFMVSAQDVDDKFVISGDLTTIYTIGNADEKEQRMGTDPQVVGQYFNNPYTGTRKNGFYTAANLYATLRPTNWIEGYFKLYGVHRPGSFYMPLQMENMNRGDFTLTLDAVYGRVNVFGALGYEWPVSLFLKAGKYKAQASQYGIVSKYKTEQVLYMMNLKTDFTYELEVAYTGLDAMKLSIFAATNYLWNQSVQRFYDEDGGMGLHGTPVVNEFAPQFLVGIKLFDINAGILRANVELLYGQNVSNIYSGHAAGLSSRFNLNISDAISIPIGLQFAFHEKNLDVLGQSAIAENLAWAKATDTMTTMEFRNTVAAALGVGFRFKHEIVAVEANLAGSFYSIQHYYRNNLNILKMSLDTQVTFLDKYFIGGGVILGNLLKSTWQTTEKAAADNKEPYYDHTFELKDNLGFEVYAGLNLGNTSKFVIGFNKNKGISVNNMLESRHEGQVKFKQADTNWGTDQLMEAGGLFFKFYFRF